MNAHPTWMLGGRPLPHIEDRDIDFSASCVIDTVSDDGAWADALRFPPFVCPLHLTGTNRTEEHGHDAR